MEGNLQVDLFMRKLQGKHKLVFEKEKEEYFRVLFDTYLKEQGDLSELREYIAAGIDDAHTIDLIANEIALSHAETAAAAAADAEKKRQELLKLQQKAEPIPTTKKEEQKREEHKREEPKKAKREEPKKEATAEVERKQSAEAERKQSVEAAAEGEKEKAKANLRQELQARGKEKCKFYPFCKNLEDCEYFHPTERCTYFPNCRFGEACLYEHEACRFKEKCTRPNCAYAHPFRKGNPMEEFMKQFMGNARGGQKKRGQPRQREQREQKE